MRVVASASPLIRQPIITPVSIKAGMHLLLAAHGIDSKDTLAAVAEGLIKVFPNNPRQLVLAAQKAAQISINLKTDDPHDQNPVINLRFIIPSLCNTFLSHPNNFMACLDLALKLSEYKISPDPIFHHYLKTSLSHYWGPSSETLMQALSDLTAVSLELAQYSFHPHSTTFTLEAQSHFYSQAPQKIPLMIALALNAAKQGMNLEICTMFLGLIHKNYPDKFSEIYAVAEQAVEKGQNPEGLIQYYYIVLSEGSTGDEALELNFSPGLTQEPDTARTQLAPLGLKSIVFQDGGRSIDLHSTPSYYILSQTEPVPAEKFPIIAPDINDRTQEPALTLTELGLGKLIFIRAHGRTLIFQMLDGSLLGVKLNKLNEPIALLRKEAKKQALYHANQTAIGLRSNYPIPLMVCNIKDLPAEAIAALTELTILNPALKVAYQNGCCTALVYKTDAAYFQFLNNPDIEASTFVSSATKNLHDLFLLARYHEINSALIELFHRITEQRNDHGDFGRYLWDISLVNGGIEDFGAGRMDSWTKALLYPNLRVSGLADLAEISTLEQLMRPRNRESYHLGPLRRFGRYAPNFYLAHYFGEYLLSWALIVGSRGRAKQELDWQNPAPLANLLINTFDYAFSVYTGVPQNTAKAFIENIINWTRVSRQMSYYMSTAYVPDMLNDFVPPEIFGQGTNVNINLIVSISRGWTRDGWQYNLLYPDLGPVNGPFPIQELIRALYFSTAFMISARSHLWQTGQ